MKTLAKLIGSAKELDETWLAGATRIGITAGASAPEVLVTELIARLKDLGVISVRQLPGVQEQVHFPLPPGLKVKTIART